MKKDRQIYLDHAATTPVDPLVIEAMIPYYTEYFGNASSLHRFGNIARRSLEESRKKVAQMINAQDDEIIFTGSGTEADNLAIKGVSRSYRKKGTKIVTSQIEHHAVLETCEALHEEGFSIEYIPTDNEGIVSLTQLENAITDDTILVSIMHSNNEIGTTQPIREIAEIVHKKGALFHTDAVQSIGKEEIDVEKDEIDLLSLSAHKIYGPKGVGALYMRKGTKITPLFHGGGHERGLRSSTENIPGIVGLAKALDLAYGRFQDDIPKIRYLRDRLIKNILGEIEDAHLAGHPVKRLPNNASFYFPGIEGEAIVLGLDERGIAASSGSACSSLKTECSHVLKALGLDEVEGRGSVRFSLGRTNTSEEVDYTLEVLPKIISDLRKISPIWGKPK